MVWSITTYDNDGILFDEYRTDWCEALDLFEERCSDCKHFHDPHLIELIEYDNNCRITVLESFDNRLGA